MSTGIDLPIVVLEWSSVSFHEDTTLFVGQNRMKVQLSGNLVSIFVIPSNGAGENLKIALSDAFALIPATSKPMWSETLKRDHQTLWVDEKGKYR